MERKVTSAGSKKGYDEELGFWTKTKRRGGAVLTMLEEKMEKIEALVMKAEEQFGPSAAVSQKKRDKSKQQRRAVKRLNQTMTSTKTLATNMIQSFLVEKTKPELKHKRYDMIPYACSLYKLK